MGRISSSGDASTIGNINVNPTPPTAEVAAETIIDTNANFTIPSGQLSVSIKCAAYEGNEFPAAPATINGIDFRVGREINFKVNPDEANSKEKTSPAYVVVANSHRIYAQYSK